MKRLHEEIWLTKIILKSEKFWQKIATADSSDFASGKKMKFFLKRPDEPGSLFVSSLKGMKTDIPDPTLSAEAVFERRMEAISEAVDKYHSYLLNYLYRMTNQWQDAENLAQELWRVVLLNFDEDKIGCLPLLRRKSYQLFIDHYRRQVRRGEIVSDEVPEISVQGQSPDFTEENEKSFRERFWADYPAIELTNQQKEALWLDARYGFTYKEIEQQIKIPASTVGDWIILARKKLAEALNTQLK